MKLSSIFGSLILVSGLLASAIGQELPQNWTHTVRIAAYGLDRNKTDQIVRQAQADHVFGIEVDNDIPGRYESYLDPTAKLKAIHDVADAAHKVGNHPFVYIAGTERIT